ncbi:unnamed protein product [Caenorhabditis auriculariae]|uniref:TLDc domain-containing protein n=1 Tax=Caenorhabditis auriculariae TaxID=2777116 RepID=A0A8S1GV52_9PELO|nr:unnamed protein product [Caenorhabditis auriculariae]
MERRRRSVKRSPTRFIEDVASLLEATLPERLWRLFSLLGFPSSNNSRSDGFFLRMLQEERENEEEEVISVDPPEPEVGGRAIVAWQPCQRAYAARNGIEELLPNPEITNAFIRSSFHRQVNRSTSTFSRASTAIRRSLRLPRRRADVSSEKTGEAPESGQDKPSKSATWRRLKDGPFDRLSRRKRTAAGRVERGWRKSRRLGGLNRCPTAVRAPMRFGYSTPAENLNTEKIDMVQENDESNARYFTAYTHSTNIVPSEIPARLEEVRENRKLNRTEKVKKIVRKTDWPPRHEVRGVLWKELCMNKDFDSSKVLFGTELEIVMRMPRQGQAPTFIGEEGLLHLLTVVERLRPDITAAPMLFPLAALMLHFMEDADGFACINYLLCTSGFMMKTVLQWQAAPYTIMALIKKHKAKSYNVLKRRVGSSEDDVLARCVGNWLHWIFHGLPLAYVCRVVDCYLVEGHKFLGRPTDDFASKTVDEKVEAIRIEILQTAMQMTVSISTDLFIETAVKIRNLQSSTVTRIQRHFEDKLREEGRGRPQPAAERSRNNIYVDAFNSVIIDAGTALDLMSALPERLQLVTPRLLFRLSEDGASFTHFWEKVQLAEQTLLIIKSTKGDIFGSFCSSGWKERHERGERCKTRFFGTGESYVFTMNFDIQMPDIYYWAGKGRDSPSKYPQYFMAATDKLLLIGSGGGDAIRIADELTHGISSPNKTYGCPSLVKNGSFDIHELEVFHVTG